MESENFRLQPDAQLAAGCYLWINLLNGLLRFITVAVHQFIVLPDHAGRGIGVVARVYDLSGKLGLIAAILHQCLDHVIRDLAPKQSIQIIIVFSII